MHSKVAEWKGTLSFFFFQPLLAKGVMDLTVNPHLCGFTSHFVAEMVSLLFRVKNKSNSAVTEPTGLIVIRYNLLFFVSGGGKFNYQGTKRWLEDNLDHTGEFWQPSVELPGGVYTAGVTIWSQSTKNILINECSFVSPPCSFFRLQPVAGQCRFCAVSGHCG